MGRGEEGRRGAGGPEKMEDRRDFDCMTRGRREKISGQKVTAGAGGEERQSTDQGRVVKADFGLYGGGPTEERAAY